MKVHRCLKYIVNDAYKCMEIDSCMKVYWCIKVHESG